MSDEVKKVQAVEDTDKSESTVRTDKFKKHLQLMFYQVMGEKISRQQAWELWKTFQKGTLKFVLEEEGHKLALSGIGNYQIIEVKARGMKAGLDKDGKPIAGVAQHDKLYRYRFYPSQAMERVVDAHFGIKSPGDEKEPVFCNFGLYSDAKTLAELLAKTQRGATAEK
jgi:hypothetical protein